MQDAIQNRTSAEEALVSADQMFDTYEQSANADTSPIYSANKSDDELLAMFEMQDQLDSEAEIDADPLSDEELEQARKSRISE